jgi:hypothetical protein
MEDDMAIRKLSSYLAAGALALGAATAAPPVAWAQPKPGRLFLLSSCSNCVTHLPTVAGNAAGDVFASWEELQNVVQQAIVARAFNASQTPLGDEFPVDRAAASAGPPQFDGAAATDANGNFVLAWATISDDQSAILAQRFDAGGNPRGGPIEVASDPASSPSTPSDFKPAIAATPDGGFVVVWVSLVTGDQPPGPPRVMSRRFGASGAPAGPAVQLSTGLALGDRPSVCVSGTGRIHAAWTFADAFHPFEPNLAGVAVRRLSAVDAPFGPEQVVAPALASDSAVAISCGPVNSYVVAWHTDQPPAVSGTDIVAQRFNRRGRATGGPFLVNQIADQNQRNPALFHDPSGAFVVVWEGKPGGVNGVRGRRFAGDGTPLSDEFQVCNGGRGDVPPLRPAISGLGVQGGFVVAVDLPFGLVGRVFSLQQAGAAAAAAVVEAGASTGNGRGAGGLWQ